MNLATGTTWNNVTNWVDNTLSYNVHFDLEHPSGLDELEVFSQRYNQKGNNGKFNLYYGLNAGRMTEIKTDNEPKSIQLLGKLFDENDKDLVLDWSMGLVNGKSMRRGLVLFSEKNYLALTVLLGAFSMLMKPYNCNTQTEKHLLKYCLFMSNENEEVSQETFTLLHKKHTSYFRDMFLGILLSPEYNVLLPSYNISLHDLIEKYKRYIPDQWSFNTMLITNNSNNLAYYYQYDNFIPLQALARNEIDSLFLEEVRRESPSILYNYLRNRQHDITHETLQSNFLQAEPVVRMFYLWWAKLNGRCFLEKEFMRLVEEFCRVNYLRSRQALYHKTFSDIIPPKPLFNSSKLKEYVGSVVGGSVTNDMLCFPSESFYLDNLKKYNEVYFNQSI